MTERFNVTTTSSPSTGACGNRLIGSGATSSCDLEERPGLGSVPSDPRSCDLGDSHARQSRGPWPAPASVERTNS
jgi:hypothetical protein